MDYINVIELSGGRCHCVVSVIYITIYSRLNSNGGNKELAEHLKDTKPARDQKVEGIA